MREEEKAARSGKDAVPFRRADGGSGRMHGDVPVPPQDEALVFQGVLSADAACAGSGDWVRNQQVFPVTGLLSLILIDQLEGDHRDQTESPRLILRKSQFPVFLRSSEQNQQHRCQKAEHYAECDAAGV